jgi:hypothetical protein
MKMNNSFDEITYNNGVITALALFYAHRERIQLSLGRDVRIYAASDHLIEMDMPESLSPELKAKIKKFRQKVLSKRVAELGQDEVEKLFEECLNILKALDKEVFGLNVVVRVR